MLFKKNVFWAGLSLCLFTALTTVSEASAQAVVGGQDTSRRVITTAVQFLTISPDARSAGMGDAGVAISSDANATHWNPSKLAFAEEDMGFSVSFSPWLQNLVNDMSLSYVSFYKRVSPIQTIGLSLRYFDMGDMQFTDNSGNILQDFNPREIAIDGTFAMALSRKFSIGGTARFIHSNLAGNFTNNQNNTAARPGTAAALDLSLYYKNKLNLQSVDADLAFGMNISNIGTKISYNDPEQQFFLPGNLRLGTALEMNFDEFNRLNVAFDINKLLVPTPPIRSAGPNSPIVSGRDPNRSLIAGVLGSFSDAPDGMSEEIQEVIFALGAEYWYNNIFAVRGGYFHEHQNKGNRQYFTLGLGLRYQAFGIDFAYLIPRTPNHPLADTLRFTLVFNFNKKNLNDSLSPTNDEVGS